MILEVTNAYQGYCHQCDEPALVGELVLKKAGNRFNLCESCLNEIRKQVNGKTLYTHPLPRENFEGKGPDFVNPMPKNKAF